MSRALACLVHTVGNQLHCLPAPKATRTFHVPQMALSVLFHQEETSFPHDLSFSKNHLLLLLYTLCHLDVRAHRDLPNFPGPPLCQTEDSTRKIRAWESMPNGTERPGRRLAVSIWQADSSRICRRKSAQTSAEWWQ